MIQTGKDSLTSGEKTPKKYSTKISILFVTNRPGGMDILYNDLVKQTFKDFEVVIVDGWKNRQKEVLEYLKDFKVKYFRGLSKKENEVWSFNKDLNLGLKNCEGEIVVFLQDYIWIADDTLEKFWENYKNAPECLVTTLGHKAKKPDKKVKDGEITIFEDEFFGVPEGISYYDWRVDKITVLWQKIDWSHWEMNLAACPAEIIEKIGGFEEGMDKYYGCDNQVLAVKANYFGYKCFVDSTIRQIGFNQDALFGRPKDWEENHWNKRERLPNLLKEIYGRLQTKNN